VYNNALSLAGKTARPIGLKAKILFFTEIIRVIHTEICVEMKVSIINGPNLNLLGKREPEIYGRESFEDYLLELKAKYPHIEFTYFQSNVEGELINELQRVGFEYDGIIMNPGGYTHTSVAIGDTIAAIKAPVVEVHISNVHAREAFRKLSHVSGKSAGSIIGLGLKGYELALLYLLK
jgi:3-dehydroquinate dehydratase II